MLIQPALAAPQQLVDLVFADPIVLVAIEDRDEHRQLAQRILQASRRGEGHSVGLTMTPLREPLVQYMANGLDPRIAERVEQAMEDVLAASAADGGERYLEWNRRIGKVGALAGLTKERAAVDLTDRYA